MTLIARIFLVSVLGTVLVAPISFAQEVDGSDLRREVRERNERINKLSIEEQLELRAAEKKAAEDPAVKAALEKRNKAIQEFRATLRASMIKADPAVEPILAKVAIRSRQGL
jgi:hypothetical protein